MSFIAIGNSVSGARSFADKTNIVSNNVANMDTEAFKKRFAIAGTQITGNGQNNNFNGGGVLLNIKNTVDIPGRIQQTANSTDFAIDGKGFAIIKTTLDAGGEYLFTKKCNFRADAAGYLKNDEGFLMAWPLDSDGNIPNANQDLASLVPVNVSNSQGVVNSTTKVDIKINLNSETPLGAESVAFTNVLDPLELQTKMGEAGAYTKSIRFTLNGTPLATNITFNQTNDLTDIRDAINLIGPAPLGSPAQPLVATIQNGKLIVNPFNITDTIEILEDGSNAVQNLFGNPAITQKGFDYNRQVEIYDSLGTRRSIDLYFKKTNTVNQWTVAAYSNDPNLVTPAGTALGTGVLTFSGATGQLVNFTGTLSSDVTIPWDLAVTGVAPQIVSFNFGIDGSGATNGGKMTQFAANFEVNALNANGAEFGNRTAVNITEKGRITSSYSNGEFTEDYQVAIATFANPNGLNELSGNIYRSTYESGEYNLREPNNGGAGGVVGSSLELSNVDMAEELTKLIVYSRAYQANTQVINENSKMLSYLMQALS